MVVQEAGLADDCRMCGQRVHFASIDGDPYAYHHLALSLDELHKPEPTNLTFRYLNTRMEEGRA